MQIEFIYDEEFQCLVKIVNNKEESRMQVDKEDLDELTFALQKLIKEKT